MVLIFIFRRPSIHQVCKNMQSSRWLFYRASLYRQTQILIHMYLECFQMQLLPNMLFSSSVIIITCLFVIIELKNELPLALYIVFPLILLITTVFLIIMLEMTSQVITLSKSIKTQWSSAFYEKSCWFNAFNRSCPPLKIVVGPFGKIGRDKMSTVIRFCLQRTIFFIVWSRQIRGRKHNHNLLTS